MQIHYLEVVTPDVDAVCATYSQLHGVSFSEPDAGLGNARTASLSHGGRIGVRAPMHEAEAPVVRPYLLVDDIEAAAKMAVESGGEIAHPPMELPGHGMFAIFIQGGIQHGVWQRDRGSESELVDHDAIAQDWRTPKESWDICDRRHSKRLWHSDQVEGAFAESVTPSRRGAV